MNASAHNDTSRGDTVVKTAGLTKTFHQRQQLQGFRAVLRGLFKPTFREVQALRGVNLEVRRGEIVAYAGPNGAGKSTTIKLLCGLLRADSGEVRVLGLDPQRDREALVARIGVVFGQRTELWWDQPLAASFEWKRKVWNVPDERYQRMCRTLKELLDLGEYFNSRPRDLSLGQRMRADLALALLPEPEILFLDEPTIGVDVLAKRNILNFIKDLSRTGNTTIVLTSHDMSELEQLAGRIVLLDRGAIAFDGDFSALRARYGDRRVLVLSTPPGTKAPDLQNAVMISSGGGRHEYTYDGSVTTLTDLVAQAGRQTQILDIESGRASIDGVVADLYESWQGAPNKNDSSVADANL
jgi:ABC-2 type transport system ATP-binding protein